MVRLSKGVWANGPLKHFLLSQSFSLWGNWFQYIALAAWIYKATGSTVWLGALAAGQQLVVMLASPFAGHAAREVGVKTLYLKAQAIGAIFSGFFALLAFLGVLTPAIGLAVAFMLAFSGAIEGACRQTFLLSLVGGADPHEAVGVDTLVYNLAKVVGPILAGGAYLAYGLTWCFAINCLSFLIAYAVVARTSGADIKARGGEDELSIGFWASAARLATRADARQVLTVYAITGFCVSPYISILPALQAQRFASDAASLGWLYSAGGVGGLAASMVMASVSRAHRPFLLGLGGALCVVGLGGLALSTRLEMALGFTALTNLGAAFCLATLQVVMLSSVSAGERALASGLTQSSYYGAYMLGAMSLGASAERFGIQASYMGAGALFALGALWTGRSMVRVARHKLSAPR